MIQVHTLFRLINKEKDISDNTSENLQFKFENNIINN